MSALEPILITSNWLHASNVTGQFRAENSATGEAIDDAIPVSGSDDIETALSAGRAGAAEMAATPSELAAAFEGNLTGLLYAANNGIDDVWSRIAAKLRPHIGCLIENKMPTGVAVGPAINHGDLYPCTSNPGSTAVGMPAALRRFTALHCYNSVDELRLPDEWRVRNPEVNSI